MRARASSRLASGPSWLASGACFTLVVASSTVARAQSTYPDNSYGPRSGVDRAATPSAGSPGAASAPPSAIPQPTLPKPRPAAAPPSTSSPTSASEGDGATDEADLAEVLAPSLRARVTWARKNLHAREGTISVSVTDSWGRPVQGASLVVLTEGVKTTEVLAKGPGESWISVHWEPEVEEIAIEASRGASKITLPPLPIVEPDRDLEQSGAECSIAPGFGFVNDGLDQRGVSVSVGCGYRFAMGKAALAVGPEVGVEGFPSLTLDFRGRSYEISQTNLVFALPISYRFLPHTRGIVPYFSLVPLLLVQMAERTETNEGDEQALSFAKHKRTTPLFGLAAKIGTQVRIGPGGFFFELGYRGVARNPSDPSIARATGVLFDLGYRVQF